MVTDFPQEMIEPGSAQRMGEGSASEKYSKVGSQDITSLILALSSRTFQITTESLLTHRSPCSQHRTVFVVSNEDEGVGTAVKLLTFLHYGSTGTQTQAWRSISWKIFVPPNAQQIAFSQEPP